MYGETFYGRHTAQDKYTYKSAVKIHVQRAKIFTL